VSAPVLPFMPSAVRAYLLSKPDFSAACLNRCSTRAPADVSKPYATVASTANPVEASAGVWSPLVQLDGWCPKGGWEGVDPEAVAWRIASLGAAWLARARNVQYQNVAYTARVAAGPLTDIDTSRGPDNPLYRALVHVELTLHAR